MRFFQPREASSLPRKKHSFLSFKKKKQTKKGQQVGKKKKKG